MLDNVGWTNIKKGIKKEPGDCSSDSLSKIGHTLLFYTFQ